MLPSIFGYVERNLFISSCSESPSQRPDVVNALHAGDKSEAWQECNGRVGAELTNKKSTSSITLLPDLLEHINILLFSGDQDFICNYIGTENLIDALEWNGAKGLGVRAVLSLSYKPLICLR